MQALCCFPKGHHQCLLLVEHGFHCSYVLRFFSNSQSVFSTRFKLNSWRYCPDGLTGSNWENTDARKPPKNPFGDGIHTCIHISYHEISNIHIYISYIYRKNKNIYMLYIYYRYRYIHITINININYIYMYIYKIHDGGERFERLLSEQNRGSRIFLPMGEPSGLALVTEAII